MRKLIVINFILAFLLVNIFIFGYYFFQYPDDFNPGRYIRDAEWKPFGLICLGIVVGAIALSFLPIQNYSRRRKVAIFLAALQLVFLSFLLFKMIGAYRQNKNEFEHLLSNYRAKADADMKAGFIEIEYVGGLELPNEK